METEFYPDVKQAMNKALDKIQEENPDLYNKVKYLRMK